MRFCFATHNQRHKQSAGLVWPISLVDRGSRVANGQNDVLMLIGIASGKGTSPHARLLILWATITASVAASHTRFIPVSNPLFFYAFPRALV